MKKIIYVFIVAISIFNLSYAGCGSCNVSGKKADSPEREFHINYLLAYYEKNYLKEI